MKISVYIISHNQKDYLKPAIESVLNQTLRPSQILIIDNNSSDGSQELIKSFCSKHSSLIEAIYNDKNKPIPETRNQALNQLTGDYITYLDGDDTFHPQKLEKESKLVKNKKSFVFSNYQLIDSEGNPLMNWLNSPPEEGDIVYDAISRNYKTKRLFRYELFHKDLLTETGNYDESLEVYEDWDWKIRLCQNGTAIFCDEVLSSYRIHQNNISGKNAYKLFQCFSQVLNKYLPLCRHLPTTEKIKIKENLLKNCSSLINKSLLELLDLNNTSNKGNQEINKFQDVLLEISQKHNKIAIYGAGQHTLKNVELIIPHSLKITAIFDDNSLEHEKFLGWPKQKPGNTNPSDFEAVLISSDTFETEMYNNLLRLGYSKDQCYKVYS
ncbi:MAG: glycosyltransferase [Lentisphaerales bacterium]|nr:glycosyltransferase [Lentisphaerales bacterium]